MEDFCFDPDFSKNLKRMFAERFEKVQYDSALRSLKMVFKDTKFTDVAVMA